MGTLNTFFNYRSSVHNRATAYTLHGMAQADRERELRARGWLSPNSLPEDLSYVEHVLAAQMRARIEMRHGRPWPYRGVTVGGVLGAVLGVLFLFGGATRADSLSGLALLLLTLVAAGLVAWRTARREERRVEALDTAREVDGRCGWCKEPAPHTLEGEVTPPRVYHALEIEQFISPVPR